MAEWNANLRPMPLPACTMGEAKDKTAPAAVQDLRLCRNSVKKGYTDAREITAAVDHILRLPEPGETLHLVHSGNYPPCAIIPAILKLSGQTIDELWIVTYSFGKAKMIELLEMLDDGRVKKCNIIGGRFFSHVARHRTRWAIFEAELAKRGARIITARSHAKVLLAKLADGRTYTIEGSGNYGSGTDIEQMHMSADPDLYAFHRQWIAGCFTKKDE